MSTPRTSTTTVKEHGSWRWLAFLLGCAWCLGQADVCRGASPTDEATANAKAIGFIMVELKFAEDGKVWSGRVVRSNAPFSLEASTIDFVRNHWKNDYFAGTTQVFPITFSELPSSCSHWNGDMPSPINPLVVGDPKRDVKLRVNFGADGWVEKVGVASSCGVDSIDRDTALWVKVHWHHPAYAGQTYDVPFQFKPPVPKPVKAAQPAPEEDAAPPAVRVM